MGGEIRRMLTHEKGTTGRSLLSSTALYGVCPRASVSGDDCPEGRKGVKWPNTIRRRSNLLHVLHLTHSVRRCCVPCLKIGGELETSALKRNRPATCVSFPNYINQFLVRLLRVLVPQDFCSTVIISSSSSSSLFSHIKTCT